MHAQVSFFLKTLAGEFRSVIYAYVVLKLIRIKTDFCVSVLFLFCLGTLKEIEELKLSVAKLKLPNEHTPRI